MSRERDEVIHDQSLTMVEHAVASPSASKRAVRGAIRFAHEQGGASLDELVQASKLPLPEVQGIIDRAQRARADERFDREEVLGRVKAASELATAYEPAPDPEQGRPLTWRVGELEAIVLELVDLVAKLTHRVVELEQRT